MAEVMVVERYTSKNKDNLGFQDFREFSKSQQMHQVEVLRDKNTLALCRLSLTRSE